MQIFIDNYFGVIFCFEIQNLMQKPQYQTRNSTNSLSSNFGLIDARMSASDKEEPVCNQILLLTFNKRFKP